MKTYNKIIIEKEELTMDDLISRQDAIDALAGMCKHYKEYIDYDDGEGFIEAIQELPSVQPEPQWIPCSERLPDNEKRVLCTVQSGEHFCVVPFIFIQHTRRWLPEVYGNHDCVIAWMPLPEPYKAERRTDETD